MGKVISIINQKGGCGKTVSTYNIAAALAEKGKTVLMIDNDQQASLTIYCGFTPADFPSHLDSVYQDQHFKLAEAIYDTKYENLSLTPANIKLASVENVLVREGKIGREILRDKIEPIKKLYDYILIDCPPALSMLTTNALVASDYALIPCQTNPLCTVALEDLMPTIDNIVHMYGKPEVLGVIATIHRKSVKVFRDELEKLENNYDVIGIIKESADVANSVLSGMPVVKYKKTSEVAQQYNDVAEQIIKEIEG